MSFEELLKTLGSGLGQFGWNDFLDIAILTVLLYKLIVWTKDTRAYEVIKGVGLLIVASSATQVLSMLVTLAFLGGGVALFIFLGPLGALVLCALLLLVALPIRLLLRKNAEKKLTNL